MRRLCAGLMLLVLSGSANAASLVAFDVDPDGSVDPPGDRIRIRVLFAPGEAPIEVTVRPYLRKLLSEPDQDPAPFLIRSKKPSLRASDGTYEYRVRLARERSAIVEVATVIEYADLDVSTGNYQLAYDLEARRDTQILFATFSKWTILNVTDKPREVTISRTVTALETVRREEQVLVPDDRVPGRLREITVERSETVEKQVNIVAGGPEKVLIPGGFDRRQQAHMVIHHHYGDPEEDIPDNQLSGADPDQWVPKPKVRVHYATNRNVVQPQATSTLRFDNELSTTLNYGSLLVNIPVEVHELGRIERPGWFQREDPAKHFIVESLTGMTEEAFRRLMASALGRSTKDVLLFVHGYNNSMEFAALRAAQIQHDIRFPGPVIIFSWPSQASARKYHRDEELAKDSVDSLVKVLEQLFLAHRSAIQPGRIHIIAHSMGNRVLLESLAKIAQSNNPPPNGAIGHVVLAAPDVSHQQFLLTFPRAAGLAQSVMMYFCKEDKALRTSRALHVDSRIGEQLVALPPLINVDASKANTSILGHDYFVTRSPLLIDLEMHLRYNTPPAQRPTLRKATIQGFTYWHFP